MVESITITLGLEKALYQGRMNLIMKQMLMKLWKDDRGQDLIEYALMAGFVAVAAGAIMPTVSQNISEIFSKVSSVMTLANS